MRISTTLIKLASQWVSQAFQVSLHVEFAMVRGVCCNLVTVNGFECIETSLDWSWRPSNNCKIRVAHNFRRQRWRLHSKQSNCYAANENYCASWYANGGAWSSAKHNTPIILESSGTVFWQWFPSSPTHMHRSRCKGSPNTWPNTHCRSAGLQDMMKK